jgi:hypothetical protein
MAAYLEDPSKVKDIRDIYEASSKRYGSKDVLVFIGLEPESVQLGGVTIETFIKEFPAELPPQTSETLRMPLRPGDFWVLAYRQMDSTLYVSLLATKPPTCPQCGSKNVTEADADVYVGYKHCRDCDHMANWLSFHPGYPPN